MLFLSVVLALPPVQSAISTSGNARARNDADADADANDDDAPLFTPALCLSVHSPSCHFLN
eukprot:1849424-Rhodomonas_salina.4